ncbi:MAG: Maf family protein [Candidatus Krumholzibacteriota bacterium]|nr:Maf family protein [Candidatus Krumholzibacteriota bacterium]
MNPFLSISSQDNLVLASGSPRRRKILEELGFDFEIFVSGIKEDEISGDNPIRKATELAELKAAYAQRFCPGKRIIGADTVVICRNQELGKPANKSEAVKMLAFLSGKPHEVVTGVVVVAPGNKMITDYESTKVYFKDLSPGEIEVYTDTAEPFDKAGGYAIQGLAAPFISKIEGCYFNVVGLPVGLLFRMLKESDSL